MPLPVSLVVRSGAHVLAEAEDVFVVALARHEPGSVELEGINVGGSSKTDATLEAVEMTAGLRPLIPTEDSGSCGSAACALPRANTV